MGKWIQIDCIGMCTSVLIASSRTCFTTPPAVLFSTFPSGAHITMKKRRLYKPSSVRVPRATIREGLLKRRLNLCGLNASLPIFVGLAFVVAASMIAVRYLNSSSRKLAFSQKLHSLLNMKRDWKEMAPVIKPRVVAEYNHDPKAFTQGLIFHDGFLYESTGLRGLSTVRKVDLATGKVLHRFDLEPDDFGEGLTLGGSDESKLVQVLWKVGKGYVYDRATLNRLFEFRFEGDAWGLAALPSDRSEMYLSDGTSNIRVFRLHGSSFQLIRQFTVMDGSSKVGLLNELEFIDNHLWANVWNSDFVAQIDITIGRVSKWVDLREILRESTIPRGHSVDVLNGIAYNEATNIVYVTGKNWPRLFAIEMTNELVAQNITKATTAFFLDSMKVKYIHNHMLV